LGLPAALHARPKRLPLLDHHGQRCGVLTGAGHAAQWGTMLAPDGSFPRAEQAILRSEVERIEKNLP
jgi:hypothetical protein